MKSIKPGRGPSMMGGVAAIFMALFGVFWTIMASSIGAPLFFCMFGVLFILLAIGNAIYNFKNATGKQRYSAYDIVDSEEEADPLNERFGQSPAYCARCGAKLPANASFCPGCGCKLGE